jgi:hypothetical protein
MKIIFLHLPKTAGQTVHETLLECFGEGAVCPARFNDDLRKMSISDINRYSIFSGHMDWSLLDCVKGHRYVFTVLRRPLDRILSFYFFLRGQAVGMSEEALNSPGFSGIRWAHQLSPDEYFTKNDAYLRNCLDPYYDNLYSYYFAGRYYAARQDLTTQIALGSMSKEDVIKIATDNLTLINDVFTTDNLSGLFLVIEDVSGNKLNPDRFRFLNANLDNTPESRLSLLAELGATEKTFSQISEWCAMDDKIWRLHA